MTTPTDEPIPPDRSTVAPPGSAAADPAVPDPAVPDAAAPIPCRAATRAPSITSMGTPEAEFLVSTRPVDGRTRVAHRVPSRPVG